MPYRERTARIVSASLFVSAALYVALVAVSSPSFDRLAPPNLPLPIIYVVILIAIAATGRGLAATFAPEDATKPRDERQRGVAGRATRLSGSVLAIGTVLALGLYVVTRDGDLLFHAAFLVLMLG